METTKDETTAGIPNLWGNLDFNIDIPTPWEILSAQAQFLNRATNGLIIAEVSTFEGSKSVTNTLDLRVPELDNIRLPILQILNRSGSPYPVLIHNPLNEKGQALGGASSAAILALYESIKGDWMNHEEMSESISKTLQSPVTIGIIESLLIRVREKRKKRSTDKTTEPISE